MKKTNTLETENKILIIDDDREILDSIVKLLKSSSYQCITACNTSRGIQLIKKEHPLLILTDLRMETVTSGIEVLEEAKKVDPDSVVLLYTAYGNVPLAVEAFKKGAFDFIQKFQTHHDIVQPVERAFKFAKMQRENAQLRTKLDLSDESGFIGAVGTSLNIVEVFEKAKRVARTSATILITGETGTGKEVIAKGIHHFSPRAEEPFIPVSVGALPDTLLESELFGYVKGAFTNANTDKPGLFEAADNGTIFLDEIGEVSSEMQHKLLRVLQDRRVRRVGSVKEREFDVRILSATNKDPEELIKTGKMREDLFYRLNVIRIDVPPLRERRGDIPHLAYHFLKKLQKTSLIPVEKISSDALLIMQQYDWPGNVRELQGVMQRMVALATHSEIRREDLPDNMIPNTKRVYVDANPSLDFKTSKAKILEEFERQYIQNLLEQYDGNISKVAEVAGLNRKTIYRLIESRNIGYRRRNT